MAKRMHSRAPQLGIFLGMVLFTAVFVGSAGAAETIAPAPTPPLPAPPALQTIKGSVLDIQGEFVVLKDISGHEVRLHVDKETRMERLKVGDTVQAMVKPDGHAESIMVQLPQQ